MSKPLGRCVWQACYVISEADLNPRNRPRRQTRSRQALVFYKHYDQFELSLFDFCELAHPIVLHVHALYMCPDKSVRGIIFYDFSSREQGH